MHQNFWGVKCNICNNNDIKCNLSEIKNMNVIQRIKSH